VKRRIVLLGPPASGKGTLAELAQNRFRIAATSTGAILRTEAKRGTPVGLEAAKIISTGGLVPDEMVLQLAAAWLDKTEGSFLFDGFPRTVRQADQFEILLSEHQLPLELAMKEYREKTLPVTDFYVRRGIFARVDANRSAEQIFTDVNVLIAG
jgi:adenylate kinase